MEKFYLYSTPICWFCNKLTFLESSSIFFCNRHNKTNIYYYCDYRYEKIQTIVIISCEIKIISHLDDGESYCYNTDFDNNLNINFHKVKLKDYFLLSQDLDESINIVNKYLKYKVFL